MSADLYSRRLPITCHMVNLQTTYLNASVFETYQNAVILSKMDLQKKTRWYSRAFGVVWCYSSASFFNRLWSVLCIWVQFVYVEFAVGICLYFNTSMVWPVPLKCRSVFTGMCVRKYNNIYITTMVTNRICLMSTLADSLQPSKTTIRST
mgnify:CR=1 FL=1